MTFHDTLQTYKNKAEASLKQVIDSIDSTKEALEMLEKQGIAITAQLETIDELMNAPPVVELPYAGEENIEELFEKRLDTHDGTAVEEVFEDRQENVYFKEAMDTVEKLDEHNREQADTEGVGSDSP